MTTTPAAPEVRRFMNEYGREIDVVARVLPNGHLSVKIASDTSRITMDVTALEATELASAINSIVAPVPPDPKTAHLEAGRKIAWDMLAKVSAVGDVADTREAAFRRIKDEIDYRLNELLVQMKDGCDDSITGFNDAWDIVRGFFDETIAYSLPSEPADTPEVDIEALVAEILTLEQSIKIDGIRFRSLALRAASALSTMAQRVAALERERDDLKADYLRRHKDACDRFLEVKALSAKLAARDAEVAAIERLQAIIDWADFAMKNPTDFNNHGVRNLDGPVFDEARKLLDEIAARQSPRAAEKGEGDGNQDR